MWTLPWARGFLGVCREHLRWLEAGGLWQVVRAPVSVGALGLTCSVWAKAPPTICLWAGRQETWHAAWQACLVATGSPWGSGRSTCVGGGRDGSKASGSHHLRTISVCSWPVQELMRWRKSMGNDGLKQIVEIFKGTWLSKELGVLDIQVALHMSTESILLAESLVQEVRSI